MKIDEVTRSVILNNLKWITEEMGEYLARAAFSTNIKIRRDCSCALYTAKGDMLAQGTFVPVHLGIMSHNDLSTRTVASQCSTVQHRHIPVGELESSLQDVRYRTSVLEEINTTG